MYHKVYTIYTLNEHAPYKRGVARPKWRSPKLSIHGPWQNVERHKSSQNHVYFNSFGTEQLPSIYTKVDTVVRASACDSCFRRAIADTKRSDKYHLLLAEKTPQGIQTQLLTARKKFSVVCVQPRCLWVQAIVWQHDHSKDSRTIVYQRSSAKKVAKYHPL